jgi:hypothetical protein
MSEFNLFRSSENHLETEERMRKKFEEFRDFQIKYSARTLAFNAYQRESFERGLPMEAAVVTYNNHCSICNSNIRISFEDVGSEVLGIPKNTGLF